MAALERTPIDEFSGMPLPLSPQYMDLRSSRFKPDDHHHWHERLDPLLRDTGGLALRHSRVQKANYDAHHLDYHRTFIGPILPTNDEDRLRPVVLAAAGYIPSKALAFAGAGDAYMVPISSEERQYMWNSGQVRVERPDAIRDFLKEYVLARDFLEFKPETIDEFLHTHSGRRKRDLGNQFLARAVRRATQPVSPYYREAHSAHMLPENKSQTVVSFVLGALSMRRYRPKIHEALTERLAG